MTGAQERPVSPSPTLDSVIAMAHQGRLAEALVAVNDLIAGASTPEAHNARGNILNALGRGVEAMAGFDRAIALDPAYAGAWFNRANVLHGLGRHDDAVESYGRALAIEPHHTEALSNRGHVLRLLGRYEEALADFRQAADQAPAVRSLLDLADALFETGDGDAALAAATRAVALDETNSNGYYLRANILSHLRRFTEAIADYDRALALKPGFAHALNNRAVALRKSHRFTEALEGYRAALALEPDNAGVQSNISHLQLLMGDFDAGWRGYEARWKLPGRAARPFDAPLWTGEDLTGRTILLHAEQGFGDTLQFCRYAPLVAARGARVLLEVPAPLEALMQSLGDVDQVIVAGSPLPAFDYHCPLLSLPRAFATRVDTIPADIPYLEAPLPHVVRWSARLAKASPSEMMRVGLVWSGATWTADDRDRSIPLDVLRRAVPAGIQAISLVRDPRPTDAQVLAADAAILNLAEDIQDFADNAALMTLVDLVISVDTASAHLAGALGVPVWLLAPHTPDWRWQMGRTDSPWYPTMRIFRQRTPGDWEPVIVEVREALEALVNGTAG